MHWVESRTSKAGQLQTQSPLIEANDCPSHKHTTKSLKQGSTMKHVISICCKRMWIKTGVSGHQADGEMQRGNS